MNFDKLTSMLTKQGVCIPDVTIHEFPGEGLNNAILCIHDLDTNEHFWLITEEDISTVKEPIDFTGEFDCLLTFTQGGVKYSFGEYQLLIIS